jgi:ubiquitin carboxyl-terminal hydrolase 7
VKRTFNGRILNLESWRSIHHACSEMNTLLHVSSLYVAVYESFKEYIAVETLDGDNKYDAGDYGMQVCIHLK